MKNMKKFITLCGFLILGSIACGDADVVKAEAINNQTTDTSGYTITIPSEVGIDKDSGKGSFAVTGKMDAQTELDVTTTWYIVIDPSNWSSTIYSSFLSTCL